MFLDKVARATEVLSPRRIPKQERLIYLTKKRVNPSPRPNHQVQPFASFILICPEPKVMSMSDLFDDVLSENDQSQDEEPPGRGEGSHFDSAARTVTKPTTSSQKNPGTNILKLVNHSVRKHFNVSDLLDEYGSDVDINVDPQ